MSKIMENLYLVLIYSALMGTVYLLDLSISPIKESAITNTPSDSEALADIGNDPSYSFIEPLACWILRK